MKVAILAGGRGSRFGDLTRNVPKPLIEVGGHPILSHVIKLFSRQGHRQFYVALGYKGEQIRRYFSEKNNWTLNDRNTSHSRVNEHDQHATNYMSVRLIDTGLGTATGGRVKRLQDEIGRETFMLAWCDGLADINFGSLLAFHRSHGRIATLVAVHPPGRFGHLTLDSQQVVAFNEKPQRTEEWINGGFFVLEPEVFEYIDGEESDWETETIQRLVCSSELMAFKHDSFWHCMDTARDKECLEAHLTSRDLIFDNAMLGLEEGAPFLLE